MRKIKEFIKRLIYLASRFLRVRGDLVSRNYEYDERIFRKYARPCLEGTARGAIASSGGGYSRAHLRALLTMEYHRIEKGLALPKPRLGFGGEVVKRLVGILKIYRRSYGDDVVTQSACNALLGYLDFHDGRLHEIDDSILVSVHECLAGLPDVTGERGIILKKRNTILNCSNIDFSAFCSSRHSIRDYENGPVDEVLIFESVADAMTTPSVCNRQASRVVFVKDPVMMTKVLELQNGNRGFGDSIGGLFVVYYDISNFVSSGERNQGWIDSGMFSMNLVFALHSRGVGSCCLNWSVGLVRDKQLVDILDLNEGSRVVMLIAVGNLKETFNVAASKKLSVSEIVRVI